MELLQTVEQATAQEASKDENTYTQLCCVLTYPQPLTVKHHHHSFVLQSCLMFCGELVVQIHPISKTREVSRERRDVAGMAQLESVSLMSHFHLCFSPLALMLLDFLFYISPLSKCNFHIPFFAPVSYILHFQVIKCHENFMSICFAYCQTFVDRGKLWQ